MQINSPSDRLIFLSKINDCIGEKDLKKFERIVNSYDKNEIVSALAEFRIDRGYKGDRRFIKKLSNMVANHVNSAALQKISDHMKPKSEKDSLENSENPMSPHRDSLESPISPEESPISPERDSIDNDEPEPPEPKRSIVNIPSSSMDSGTRRKIGSEVNFTPSRQISWELKDLTLEPHTALESDSPQAVALRDLIQDDGERRIQVLYLQLMAYWNEGCTVQLDRTSDQYGGGQIQGFSGAHSAILPNLKDDHLQQLFNTIVTEGGASEQVRTKLQQLGFANEDIQNLTTEPTEATWEKALQNLSDHDKQSLISESTHLYHVANSTLELPSYINIYHQLIEAKLRPFAEELLNQVSKEGKDPYQALKEFSTELKTFLSSSDAQTRKKIVLIDKFLAETERLAKLKQQLSAPSKNNDEWASLLHNYVSCTENIYVLIKEIDALKDYSLRFTKIDLAKAAGSPFKTASQVRILLEKLSKLRGPQAQKTLQDATKKVADTIQPKSDRVENRQRSLVNSLTVIDILNRASKCPPRDVLSGKSTPEGWEELSTEELLEQKREILTRRYEISREKSDPDVYRNAA